MVASMGDREADAEGESIKVLKPASLCYPCFHGWAASLYRFQRIENVSVSRRVRDTGVLPSSMIPNKGNVQKEQTKVTSQLLVS